MVQSILRVVPQKCDYLILFSCSLKPKVMKSIEKLFLNLKRLVLSYYKVICECDQQIDNNYMALDVTTNLKNFCRK